MIGKITAFFGGESVNIAELQVARNQDNKTEMMLIKTDQEVSETQLRHLKKIKGVFEAWTINL